MRKGNIVSSLIIIALGVFMIMEARNMHSGFGGGLSPGVFPTLIGYAFAVLGAIQLAWEFIPRFKSQDEVNWPEGEWRKKVLCMMGGILVYMSIIEVVGFALATLLLVIWALKILGSYKWQVNIGLGVLVAGICTLVFQVLLDVNLPVGWFGI